MKNHFVLSIIGLLTFAITSCQKSGSEVSFSTDSKPTANINVTKPTNELSNDFAFGVDMSMVKENESLGGIYKDENNNPDDPFKILKDDGANYTRIRLWVDPYSSINKKPYKGGTNDIETDIQLAKRAKENGMKVLLDLHYSDFWADPSHQWKPKAWDTVNTIVVANYTKEVLNKFLVQSINIDSIQIGNEINYAFIGNYTGTTYYSLLQAGINAAKEIYPNVKVVLHLTDVNKDVIYNHIDGLVSYVSNFDIIGLSYYPYWHGPISNLLAVMNYISSKGKDAMVVETSWGFTLDYDKNYYSSNQFNSEFASIGGYEVSPQGQADMLCAIIDALSKVNNNRGKGIFYWGSDYLPIKGAYWASIEGQYYNDYGTDGSGEYTADSCRISWANQSLFDYDGKVLDSAQTYKLIQNIM